MITVSLGVENNIDKFRCIICNKSYKDNSELWYHNNKNHNNSESMYM
jgi:hypothetical protein